MNEKTANPAKTCVRSCVQKILRTQNCRCKFIKILIPEKRKPKKRPLFAK